MTAEDLLQTLEAYYGAKYSQAAKEAILAKLGNVSGQIVDLVFNEIIDNDGRLPLWNTIKDRLYAARVLFHDAQSPATLLEERDPRGDPIGIAFLEKMRAQLGQRRGVHGSLPQTRG